MAGSKKVPETIKATFGSHSNEEITTMRELYTETNLNSKSALFPVTRTNEELDKKLTDVHDLIDNLKLLLDQTYVNENTAPPIPTEREEELAPLAHLIAYFGRDGQKHEYPIQDFARKREIRQAILNQLLTLPEEQLAQLIPLTGHINKLDEFKIEALLNSQASVRALEPHLMELIALEDKANQEAHLAKLHKEREELLLDIQELAEKRNKLPVRLAYYKAELKKTNPASFRFLTEEQKAGLKNKLLFTYFLLYSAYQLDATEGRNYTLDDHQALLDLCSQRIQELDLNPERGEKPDFQNDLEV
jgi:hypothetical protein